MSVRYNGDIMEKLKAAGWSEYKIRQQNKLSTSTIKALRAGDTGITVRVLDRICEMLGGAQPNDVLIYESDYKAVARAKNEPVYDDELGPVLEAARAEYAALENPEIPWSTFMGLRVQEFFLSRNKGG